MRSTNLFSSLFDDKEHVGPITDSKCESVFEGITAIMVVTDAVLIDVVHSEGVCLSVMLTVTGALDGTVTRSLNNSKCNRVLLTARNKEIVKHLGNEMNTCGFIGQMLAICTSECEKSTSL